MHCFIEKNLYVVAFFIVFAFQVICEGVANIFWN